MKCSWQKTILYIIQENRPLHRVLFIFDVIRALVLCLVVTRPQLTLQLPRIWISPLPSLGTRLQGQRQCDCCCRPFGGNAISQGGIMGGGKKSSYAGTPAMVLLLGVLAVFLGGLPEVNAGLKFNERFLDRGRAMHELGDVKEYEHKQGFEATLNFVSSSGNSTYGADINPLHLVVRVEKSTRLRVYISDFSNHRWEVPHDLVPRQRIDSGLKDSMVHELAVTYTRKPFGFAVTRISTGDVLFNSTPPTSATNNGFVFNPLVFKDQYLELSTQLPPTASLYGLGESTRPTGLKLKTNHTYTLWATDTGSINLDVDLYGSYPFYLDVREGGISHGVLLLNSNGIEVTYNHDSLTYKVLGGILDFYFFPGPTPLDVVDQFTQLVGRPAAQPYWSFGFHQCRWGYKNLTMTKNVVENYKKAKIPLDTMWNDIDYMEKYKDFTLDPVRFPLKELRSFVDELHANGQQYIIIVDPGIATAYKDYGTYLRGLEADIYLKKQNGDNYLGQVWPGPVYFPDFLHPNASEWWTKETQFFHDQIPFDGMWIDMNELANFCTGSSCTFNGTVIDELTSCYLQCPDDSFNHTKYDVPGFKINHNGGYEGLGYRTAAMTVKHYDGTLEYDAHNLYGLAESIATNKAMTLARNKRPFVLSRSTFIGSGAHTAHWTGDNGASFNDLAYSIVTVLNSGIVGIPMIGADICGFNDETTEDTCNRWIQTGAFHPFSRAHNGLQNKPKELYIWESVTISAQKALGLRYRLLPFFYTLNYEAHKMGYPIVRPLFFAFPLDVNTLDVSYQFLIGNNILVSPVVTANTTSVEAYFPKGTWYNMFDWSKVVSNGENFTLDAPWDTINVHVHDGSIITLQDSALTSSEVKKTPFTLVVAFPSDSLLSSANGYIFLDSGDEIVMDLVANKSSLITFKADFENGSGVLTSKVEHAEYALKEGWIIDHIVLLGGKDKPTSFNLNNVTINPTINVLGSSGLYISGLGHPLGQSFEFKWTS